MFMIAKIEEFDQDRYSVTETPTSSNESHVFSEIDEALAYIRAEIA